jgi:hypothetical protein
VFVLSVFSFSVHCFAGSCHIDGHLLDVVDKDKLQVGGVFGLPFFVVNVLSIEAA